MYEKTIEYVARSSLCTGCGTCVSLCPRSAIEISRDNPEGVYLPEIKKEKCNRCRICLQVCAGLGIDSKRLSPCVDNRQSSELKTASDIGPTIACYFGHSTDYNIRYNSSSGGLITALLVFALDNGIIDGALVTEMDKHKPLSPRSFIARTREEIIGASKSKYCPVPANTAIKEILSRNGKYAVVGLPCHIVGARKSEQMKRELEKRIKLHFGVFCSGTSNFNGTEFILHHLGISDKNVKLIEYRGRGWPGQVFVELRSGGSYQIPYGSYAVYNTHSFFTPTRCLICLDGLAELSDISFGDAWFPEIIRKEKIGESVILSRTSAGEELLQTAVASGAIKLTKAGPSAISIIRERARARRSGKRSKLLLLRLLGKQLPDFKLPVSKLSFSDYLRSSAALLNRYVASKRFLWETVDPLWRLEANLEKLTESPNANNVYCQ